MEKTSAKFAKFVVREAEVCHTRMFVCAGIPQTSKAERSLRCSAADGSGGVSVGVEPRGGRATFAAARVAG
ncbi:MAG: hypothetical protein IPN95_08220 [Bacteroidetes bacterium]|nr:hypothetical protein [Bacteroidota bacterium]